MVTLLSRSLFSNSLAGQASLFRPQALHAFSAKTAAYRFGSQTRFADGSATTIGQSRKLLLAALRLWELKNGIRQ
jgi:hypothetical protein